MPGDVVTLFLCGDVMLGRGIDQILPHPGPPTLRESHVRDARHYVHLAERAHGPVPRPVDFTWPWGEALGVLEAAAPDVRVLNLETAVTGRGAFDRDTSVHYRMAPDNLPCLTAAHPDVCVLANNHVLDFGRRGLEETLDSLAGARLTTAGAGRDRQRARRPAVVPLEDGGRVLVLAVGTASSGIPPRWAATADRPGVAFLGRPSEETADRLVERVRRHRRQRDLVVVSIHWGSNWGYRISRAQRDFAHTLIDGGVDVVHGHSSHHPRSVEIHRGRPVLYGCGDLVNDYEGIGGHEEYPDLRLLYLVSLARDTGELVELRMVPLQARRMRLRRAPDDATRRLRSELDRVSRRLGTRIRGGPDALEVRPD